MYTAAFSKLPYIASGFMAKRWPQKEAQEEAAKPLKKTRRPTTISRNKRSGPRSIVVANVTQLFCDFRSDLKSTFILWKK